MLLPLHPFIIAYHSCANIVTAAQILLGIRCGFYRTRKSINLNTEQAECKIVAYDRRESDLLTYVNQIVQRLFMSLNSAAVRTNSIYNFHFDRWEINVQKTAQ